MNARNAELNFGTYLCLIHQETNLSSIIFVSTTPGLVLDIRNSENRHWFVSQMMHIAEKAGPDDRACHELFGGRAIDGSDLSLLVPLSMVC